MHTCMHCLGNIQILLQSFLICFVPPDLNPVAFLGISFFCLFPVSLPHTLGTLLVNFVFESLVRNKNKKKTPLSKICQPVVGDAPPLS